VQQQFHKAAGIAGLMSEPQEFQPTVDLGTNTRSVSAPQVMQPMEDVAINTRSVSAPQVMQPMEDVAINTQRVSAPQVMQPMEDVAINTQCVFEDYSHSFVAPDLIVSDNENYSYPNAASCPDCGGGMIRLGGCFSCPSCGFESCSV